MTAGDKVTANQINTAQERQEGGMRGGGGGGKGYIERDKARGG